MATPAGEIACRSVATRSAFNHGLPSTAAAPARSAASHRSRRGKSSTATTGACRLASVEQNAVKRLSSTSPNCPPSQTASRHALHRLSFASHPHRFTARFRNRIADRGGRVPAIRRNRHALSYQNSHPLAAPALHPFVPILDNCPPPAVPTAAATTRETRTNTIAPRPLAAAPSAFPLRTNYPRAIRNRRAAHSAAVASTPAARPHRADSEQPRTNFRQSRPNVRRRPHQCHRFREVGVLHVAHEPHIRLGSQSVGHLHPCNFPTSAGRGSPNRGPQSNLGPLVHRTPPANRTEKTRR